MDIPLYQYRIVEVVRDGEPEFILQRGVSGFVDGISSKIHWRDALPASVPHPDVAVVLARALARQDSVETKGGKIVWTSPEE